MRAEFPIGAVRNALVYVVELGQGGLKTRLCRRETARRCGH